MTLALDDNGRLVDTIDPDADLDYQIDLTEWLAGDTLASLTVTAVGCTTHDKGIVGTVIRAWVTGFTGRSATLTFHFTTANVVPRVDERTIYFIVTKK